MKLICATIFSFYCFELAFGSSCSDLTGTWRNQLNSNMTIESVTNNVITGVYHTAVESKEGAARFSSKVSGYVSSLGFGNVVGFNVLWNHGASLTAWVGQCMVCDGKETLFTTWVLRSYVPARKRWMTTRINQDTFSRVDATEHGENQVITSSVGESTGSSAGVQGSWTSNVGVSFDINDIHEEGRWTGVHHADAQSTAVGRFDGNQTYTAVGYIAVAAPHIIRGVTGHIDNLDSTTKILETSWLEHTFNLDCKNPRKTVNFGMDNFSHSYIFGS